MHLTQLSPETLTEFANSLPRSSFEQSAEMVSLLQKRGYQTIILGLTDQDHLKAAAVLYGQPIAGGLRMEVHYGPIYTDYNSLQMFLSELRSYAKANRILELIIKPYDIYQTFDHFGNPKSDENTQIIDSFRGAGFHFNGLTKGFEHSDWHYLKDLTAKSEGALLKTYNKNCQRNIKKAQKLGITIRQLSREEMPLFKDILQETEARQGFSAKPLEYFEKLYDSFDCADFLIAELNLPKALSALEDSKAKLDPTSKAYQQELSSLTKQIELLKEYRDKSKTDTISLAVALIIFTKNEATYLYGGGRSDYQKLSAPFLIQHHAMLTAMEKGITTYNFLGISGYFDDSDGVLRFKQNFNGYVTRCPGEFVYHPKPVLFKTLRLIKQLLGRG